MADWRVALERDARNRLTQTRREAMTHGSLLIGAARSLLAALALLACSTAVVQAQVYEFGRILAGGAGGTDPEKRRIVSGMGAYMCLDVSPGMTAGGSAVKLTIWSKIPQPNSRVRNIAIDLGRHANLLANLSVTLQSPGVKAKFGAAQPHAFLPGLKPTYWLDIPGPGGIAPGGLIILTATLGSGKTHADVLNAIHEGMSAATANNGLRLGLVVNSLLGGPPPGVTTISDDGGFVVSGVGRVCQQR